jgi:hypothetical protein
MVDQLLQDAFELKDPLVAGMEYCTSLILSKELISTAIEEGVSGSTAITAINKVADVVDLSTSIWLNCILVLNLGIRTVSPLRASFNFCYRLIHWHLAASSFLLLASITSFICHNAVCMVPSHYCLRQVIRQLRCLHGEAVLIHVISLDATRDIVLLYLINLTRKPHQSVEGVNRAAASFT